MCVYIYIYIYIYSFIFYLFLISEHPQSNDSFFPDTIHAAVTPNLSLPVLLITHTLSLSANNFIFTSPNPHKRPCHGPFRTQPGLCFRSFQDQHFLNGNHVDCPNIGGAGHVKIRPNYSPLTLPLPTTHINHVRAPLTPTPDIESSTLPTSPTKLSPPPPPDPPSPALV